MSEESKETGEGAVAPSAAAAAAAAGGRHASRGTRCQTPMRMSEKPNKHQRDQPAMKRFLVNGVWELDFRLGDGAFGEVYSAHDVKSWEKVAVKLGRFGDVNHFLKDEAEMYRKIGRGPGIPRVHWYGTVGTYNAMVMEFLGMSVEKVMHSRPGTLFPVTIVAHLGIQLVTALEHIHSKGVLHLDLKPENFLFGKPGTPEATKIFIGDFGLARLYMDRGRHVRLHHGRSFVGTTRCASVNIHHGLTPARRDDIESLVYSLIYMVTGTLPWKGLRGFTHSKKMKQILSLKLSSSFEGKIPGEFCRLLAYARELGFDEAPSYDFMRSMLRAVMDTAAADGPIEAEVRDILECRRRASSSSLPPQSRLLSVSTE